MPVTPERSARFAQALDAGAAGLAPAPVLDRARGARLRPGAGRGVRRRVRARSSGRGVDAPPSRRPRTPQHVPAPPDDRPAADRRAARRARRARRRRGAAAPRGRASDDEDARRRGAGRGERRGAAARQALRRARARRARRALPADDAAARSRRPTRRTRRAERDRRGEHIDLRRTLRGSLRTGGDPIRLARRRRRVVRRRIVLLCDISGSMEPYARAYLQFLTCAAGSGPNAEAFVFATRLTRVTRALAVAQPRARDPARRGGRAGLVERDAHRRRAARVQRPPRPPRDGPRRRDRDPLRRLGARRARRSSAARWQRLARLAYRIVWVNPRVERERLRAAGRRHGGGAAAHRRARQRPQPRRARRGRRRDRRRARRRGLGARAAGARAERRAWASATPVAGSSVAMPSGYGPSRGNTTPGWTRDDQDVHLPGLRPARGAAAPARRPAAELLRPRGPQRPDRAPGAPAPRARGAERHRTRSPSDG